MLENFKKIGGFDVDAGKFLAVFWVAERTFTAQFNRVADKNDSKNVGKRCRKIQKTMTKTSENNDNFECHCFLN